MPPRRAARPAKHPEFKPLERATAMKHIKTGRRRREFDVLFATRDAQAAMMTLPPGGASDGSPSNEHPRCEQWLFVLSGSGHAIIGKRRTSLRRVPLAENSLLVIEKGELHQIKNASRSPLRTLNLYVPPAYEPDAEPRPEAKGGRKTRRAKRATIPYPDRHLFSRISTTEDSCDDSLADRWLTSESSAVL